MQKECNLSCGRKDECEFTAITMKKKEFLVVIYSFDYALGYTGDEGRICSFHAGKVVCGSDDRYTIL